QTAVTSVDVVNGFCKTGNLFSPRIARIVSPVVELFKNAERHGINHYALLEDHHPAGSEEFTIYPPHCIEDSQEAKTVDELNELPQAYKFQTLPKKTINPGIEKNLQEWLDRNDQLRQFIVVGDCTDICVYLLAIYLKTRSVEQQTHFNVVVPANCVD